MNDPLRPSSLLGAAVPATAPSGVLATIPNPPPDVARLAAGTILRGVVVGEDGKGRVLVRTELGTLAVATKVHLAPDAEVTLQVRSSGAQLHVLLMQTRAQAAAAPGRLAPQGSAGSGGAQANAPPAPAAAGTPALAAHGPAAAPPDLLSLGQLVRAVLQTPAAPPDAAAGSASTLPPALFRLAPGSELQVRILAVSAPPVQDQGPASATAGQAAAAPPAAATPAPAAQGQGGTVAGTAPPAARINAGAPPQPQATPGASAAVPAQGASASGSAAPQVRPAPPPLAPIAGQPTPGAPTPGVARNRAPPAIPPPAAGPGQPSAPGLGAGSTATPAPSAPVRPGPVVAPGAGQPSAQAAGSAEVAGPRPGAAPAVGIAQPSSPPIPTGALRFTGEVTAVTHAGQPVLRTPLGTMTLELEASLPPGGRVTLELPAGALPDGEAPAGPTPRPLGHAWLALEEALQALQELGTPGAATPPVPHGVPQPGPRLASGILFFLSALSRGEMSRWLGAQTVQLLKNAGRDGLLNRLGQDFGQMSRLADGTGGDWRLVPIPIWDGHEVQQLRLFLRHRDRRRGAAGSQDGDEATRFILEVEMSRLGELQLDGLVRAKRFDLILRTRQPLPEAMRHDIRQIFQDANDAAGYAGGLGFQASREWRFLPIESPAAAASSSLVV
ncbi:MAG: hypothetical protein ACE5GS_01995 [Kiloniellaceae bacterium]